MIKVVYATITAPYQLVTGVRAMVYQGTHWPADDPVVREHPNWFSDDPRYGMIFSVEPDGYDAPIETATAAPGEKRSVRRAG